MLRLFFLFYKQGLSTDTPDFLYNGYYNSSSAVMADMTSHDISLGVWYALAFDCKEAENDAILIMAIRNIIKERETVHKTIYLLQNSMV